MDQGSFLDVVAREGQKSFVDATRERQPSLTLSMMSSAASSSAQVAKNSNCFQNSNILNFLAHANVGVVRVKILK